MWRNRVHPIQIYNLNKRFYSLAWLIFTRTGSVYFPFLSYFENYFRSVQQPEDILIRTILLLDPVNNSDYSENFFRSISSSTNISHESWEGMLAESRTIL